MSRTAGPRSNGGPSGVQRIKRAGVTGLTLIIPLVVTLLVLLFVWGFIASLITPLSSTIANVLGLDSRTERYVLLGLTTVGLGVLIVLLGLVANATSGSRLEEAFDDFVGSIPGIGAVYSTFDEMSEMLLDSESQSFQEVVMVEYPTEGAYCVAFLTAETPQFVRDTLGEDEMVSVFMPMGPNPFMGGFPLHISTDRVHDIDMTVEEGIRSIVTSGVAMGQEDVPEGTTALDHGAPGASAVGANGSPIDGTGRTREADQGKGSE